MANRWTKEQKQAIDARGSDLLIAAAAGSGKTAVLVERIITKLLREAGNRQTARGDVYECGSIRNAAEDWRGDCEAAGGNAGGYPFAKPDGVFAKGRYQDYSCLLLAGDSGILSFVGA